MKNNIKNLAIAYINNAAIKFGTNTIYIIKNMSIRISGNSSISKKFSFFKYLIIKIPLFYY